MNFVLDINTFHKFFKKDHADFVNYKAMYELLYKGKLIMVYGGETYKSELLALEDYLGTIIELKDKYYCKELENDDDIDDIEETCYSLQKKSKKFDDAHLIAIIIVGRCKLLITEDSNCMCFVKDKKFYPSSFKRPQIYSKNGWPKKKLGKFISSL